MNPERLKLLEQHVLDDPNDPFNTYALALEWMKSDTERARALFGELLKHHPEYVPTYYHAALLEINAGSSDQAGAIIRKGIEVAGTAGDKKTVGELRFLLDEM